MKTFRFLSALASDSDDAPKKDKPLVDGVLESGEFLLFTAPAKAGKSFALLDFAFSLAHGEDWLGASTHKSDVLFVNFESTRAAFLNRLFAIAAARRLSASIPEFGFLNLRGLALSPLEMAQYIAKRVKGAKKLEDHDYAAIVIDPVSAVLHNPKAVRSNIPQEQALLQMVEVLISLTGSAVVAATNPDEYPELEAHADSRIILSPIEGAPDMFSLRGEFRNFAPQVAKDCIWRYPRFTV